MQLLDLYVRSIFSIFLFFINLPLLVQMDKSKHVIIHSKCSYDICEINSLRFIKEIVKNYFFLQILSNWYSIRWRSLCFFRKKARFYIPIKMLLFFLLKGNIFKMQYQIFKTDNSYFGNNFLVLRKLYHSLFSRNPSTISFDFM